MDTTHDESHVHHWDIVMQAGPTSPGACSCGRRRDFANRPGASSERPLRNHHVRRYTGQGGD